MLVSAGDRHSEAGMKPVRQGGGWLIDSARSSAAMVRERRGHRLRDRCTLRQEHQHLLDAGVVALEHVEHDLEVRQRLRQRIPDVAEYLVDLIGGRRRLAQHAFQVLVLLRRTARPGCSGCAPSARWRHSS